MLPETGSVFISVRDPDKPQAVHLARRLIALGFRVIATRGTAAMLAEAGLEVGTVNKVLEGKPDIVDSMVDGEVQLVFNTTEGTQAIIDSLSLRRTALMNQIPYSTTLAGAKAAVEAIAAAQAGRLEVVP